MPILMNKKKMKVGIGRRGGQKTKRSHDLRNLGCLGHSHHHIHHHLSKFPFRTFSEDGGKNPKSTVLS